MRFIEQAVVIVLVLAAVAATCLSQEQYPKPLIHTPDNHPARRVILLSIDGLHAFDLQRWVAGHPNSTLAALSRRGVTYTNARLPWDDPAVGMLALSTGGTPLSTGIFAADFYDRSLSAAGSRCESHGSPIDLLSMTDDVLTRPGEASALLPRDPANGCKPVTPHEMVRVSNIFEIVHSHNGRTAWAGNIPGLVDLYRGPSGLGLTEAISIPSNNDDQSAASASDDRRLAIVLNWVHGRDAEDRSHVGTPELLGMNFTAFAMAQHAPGDGYIDMLGTPTEALTSQLEHIDASIGRIVEALSEEHLYDSTWIIVTATYAQSIVRRTSRTITVAKLRAVLDQGFSGETAYFSTEEGAAMIWLHQPAKASQVARAYAAKSADLGIGEVYTHDRLKLFLDPEQSTSRSPDLVLLPRAGVVWSSNVIGANRTSPIDDESTHVALLVSGAQLTGRSDPTLVPTTQTAALLLRALGLEKLDLPALHQEHSPALPGVF